MIVVGVIALPGNVTMQIGAMTLRHTMTDGAAQPGGIREMKALTADRRRHGPMVTILIVGLIAETNRARSGGSKPGDSLRELDGFLTLRSLWRAALRRVSGQPAGRANNAHSLVTQSLSTGRKNR